jgi:hypothetical protein
MPRSPVHNDKNAVNKYIKKDNSLRTDTESAIQDRFEVNQMPRSPVRNDQKAKFKDVFLTDPT